MKNIFLFLFCSVVLQPVFSQTDILDHTFSNDGKVTTAFDGKSILYAMVLQPDQKIVAVGGFANGSPTNGDFAVARYETDGSLDSSFGLNGKRTINFTSLNDVVRAVLIQPDGKIVVAGSAFTGSNSDFALARLLENGDLDSTFGINGLRTTAIISSWHSQIMAVALQADGRIVTAGTTYSIGFPQSSRFALARYMPSGTLDSTFGQNGIVITTIDSMDYLTSMAIQPNGKIVTAGYTLHSGDDDWAVAQYNTDGSLDSLFGVNGKQITDFTGHNDRLQALTLQPDGKIITAGSTSLGNTSSLALVRYLPNGLLDNTFGINGKAISYLTDTPLSEVANAVLLHPDGKIMTAGWTVDNSVYKGHFTVARFQTNGQLDFDFNGNGVAITPFVGGGDELAYAIVLQADGKVVAGGWTSKPDFALARYLPEAIVSVNAAPFSDTPVLIYPNPVGATITVEYTLRKAEPVSIVLYDQSGKVMTQLANQVNQDAGWHRQTFALPGNLPAGGYLLTVSSSQGTTSWQVVK